MSPFSVIFCGTPSFACPSLRRLAEDESFDVRLVITQPDRPVGRKKLLTPPEVKLVAEELEIPVWQPEKLNKEFDQIPVHSCDFLVVVAYGQIISQRVLDFPNIAPINVHGSLLPRWRGAAPIQWGILSGDEQGGVTVQRMVRELDAGPILSSQSVPFTDSTVVSEAYDTLSEVGAKLLCETLKKPLIETPQDESKVTVCGKLDRSDGITDPSTMTAQEIDRKVRALVPWPGVTCTVMGEKVKLISVSLEPTETSLSLPCADSTVLHIETIQSEGKKAVAGAEWLRGRQVSD